MRLLRSHIALCSKSCRHCFQKCTVKSVRNAHVNYFDLVTITRKHDVTWFDVLVNDFTLVQMIDATYHLTSNLLNHFDWKAWIDCNKIIEISAITILQNEMSFMLFLLWIILPHKVLVFNDVFVINFDSNLKFCKLLLDILNCLFWVIHILSNFINKITI